MMAPYSSKNIKRTCTVCNIEFVANSHNQTTCSEKCRRYNQGRASYQKDMTNGTIGAIAELSVTADLLKNGYSVFRPVSPNCFCDIIAIKDQEIRKIEVRSGNYLPSGKINYPTKHHPEATEFAVFTHIDNKVLYIPICCLP